MTSTPIYSQNDFDSHSAELLAEYNAEQECTVKSELNNCVRLAKLKSMLAAKYDGNTNAKGYKKEASILVDATTSKKSQFQRDVQVGNYLIQNPDNTDLLAMPKTRIYNTYIAEPKEKKEPKPKPAVKVNSDQIIISKSDYDYLKRESMYYQALMNLMGDRADSILEKALKSKS